MPGATGASTRTWRRIFQPKEASSIGSKPRDRRKLVQRALLALPVDYRQVVVLRHFGELGYDDIAATLGIPVKTVKSRLYTARQRLFELLALTNGH